MGGESRAILIAGTSSGSGKTTITLGLLAALRRMGLTVQPFKCGPDFIDPSLHQLACGRVSRNLDLWMMGEARVRETFARQASLADISVIEGVMGMFDGGASSSAALAKGLGVPVVLILDVRSAAESVAAVLKGFETLDFEVAPVAVILNRVASQRHLELVSKAIRAHCRAEILGHLPHTLDFAMPARHLGLFIGEEQPLSPEALESLAASISAQVNLPRLLELAAGAALPFRLETRPLRQVSVRVVGWADGHDCGSFSAGIPPASEAPATSCTSMCPAADEPAAIMTIGPVVNDSALSEPWSPHMLEPQPRIGVARDKAFCFYYEDNLDLLRDAGAELYFFSPLTDPCLPEGLGGLYLGGGYPELYARELSGNLGMRQAVYDWAESGRPLYAECGGFMYLSEGIVGDEFGSLPMAGVFPVTARMQKRRAALGYREVRLEKDCFFGPAGTVLRGHEFHYSVIDEMPGHIERIYAMDSCTGGDGTREGYRRHNVLGGYLHLHFGFCPQMAREFVRACRTEGNKL